MAVRHQIELPPVFALANPLIGSAVGSTRADRSLVFTASWNNLMVAVEVEGLATWQPHRAAADVMALGAWALELPEPLDVRFSSRFNGSITHMILSLVITPTADGATGNSYMVELGGRDPNKITRMGNYEDVYAKTADGWRFKTRTHTRAPNGQLPAPPK